jgi:hypothetical protein
VKIDFNFQTLQVGFLSSCYYQRYFPTSKTLVDLINFFGESEGFSEVIDRIHDEDHKIPLSSALYYLKAIDLVRTLKHFTGRLIIKGKQFI